MAAEYPERVAGYEYTPDSVALQSMQSGYAGIMYSAYAQEGMERHGAFYSSPYGHAGIYGDSALYPYTAAHARYWDERSPYSRAHYEEKYYPSGTRGATGHTYPGYITSPQHESPRTNMSDSRESYRGGDSVSQTAAGGSSGAGSGNSTNYDCAHTTTQCSRSSSREATTTYNHSQSGQTHSVYPVSYSNRSESSASEVDVTEDYEKRHNTERFKDSCRVTSGHVTQNGDSKDVVQATSVIMRRQPTTTAPSTNTNSTVSNSRSHDHNPLKSNTNTSELRTKSLLETNQNSLYSHCTYESYKQSPQYHSSSFQNARTYPVMPQAGYTSVIVDTQQYHHMANGYVH